MLHGTASSGGTLVASWPTVWHSHSNELHVLMLTIALRNKALHLFLPRSLCDLAIQDPIDTPSSARYLSFWANCFHVDYALGQLGPVSLGSSGACKYRKSGLMNTIMQMIWSADLLITNTVFGDCLAVNRTMQNCRESMAIYPNFTTSLLHGQVIEPHPLDPAL